MKCIKRKPRQICIFLNGIAGWEVSHVCLLPWCLEGGWFILAECSKDRCQSREQTQIPSPKQLATRNVGWIAVKGALVVVEGISRLLQVN